MGSVVSYLKKPKKILILGPRFSGKTSVFERIAMANKVKPKVDQKCQFNFLKLRHFNVWDLKCKLEFLQYYCDNASCVIFVFDAENEEESTSMLREVAFSKELRNAVVLVLINKVQIKIDLRKTEARIGKILKRRQFMTFKNSKGGDFQGLKEGFDWMVGCSNERRRY